MPTHSPEYVNINRRWTMSKKISFLPNGLVNDPEYYKRIPSSRDYTVASFSKMDLLVKELRQSDLESCNNNFFLTGFVVSVVLNILNSRNNNDYQILDEVLSTNIFTQSAFSDYFLKNVNLYKLKIILPTIIKQHFYLGLVDFENMTFCFIDPLGSHVYKSKKFLNQFTTFMRRYNNFKELQTPYLNHTSLKPISIKHIIQKDGYNCGPIILYIFQQIAKKESAEIPQDMTCYRKVIKEMILNTSPKMTDICILCARTCTTIDSIECNYCKRFVHYNCLKLDDHYFISNNMCDICKIY